MTPIDKLKRRAIGAVHDHRQVFLDPQSVLDLIAESERMRAVLRSAVDLYGKPGGPWNVPSDPGSWIASAREISGDESQ